MQIIRFSVGDILEMKKAHPCGTGRMEVLYTGSDVKVRCLGCGREVFVPRIKLERNIKNVIPKNSGSEKA